MSGLAILSRVLKPVAAGVLLIAGAVVFGSAPAIAQPPTPDDPADRQVHDHTSPPAAEPDGPAVDLSVVYTFDVWRNTRGGLRRGWRYLDNLDVTLSVDAERALTWDGATLFLYGLYNNGRSLSEDLVGDAQVVSNIEAGVKAARVYEAWLEQRFAADRASVKLGLYDLNSEFDTTETSGLFINSSHGIGPDFSQSGLNGPSIFPVTSLAVRVDFRVTENWVVRAAVLDGVPGDPAKPERTAIKLGRGDGALIVGELNYLDDQTKVAVGHWRYTARFEDLLASAEAGQLVWRSNNVGFYMALERKLKREAEDAVQGLSGWARLGFANEKLNPIKRYLGGGLVYTGPFRGRDSDQIGLAFGWIDFGSSYRRALTLAGERARRREINVEATYRFALARWLVLQPDLQYVIDPSESPGGRNALVVGLRTEIGF